MALFRNVPKTSLPEKGNSYENADRPTAATHSLGFREPHARLDPRTDLGRCIPTLGPPRLAPRFPGRRLVRGRKAAKPGDRRRVFESGVDDDCKRAIPKARTRPRVLNKQEYLW
jgi:hypothetical protein